MQLYPIAPSPAAPPSHRGAGPAAYPSSLTDAEWAVIAPVLTPHPPRPARPRGGRPPKHPLRQIIDAVRYLVRSGGAWRLLPGDFPPWQTVYWWFAKWAADGTVDRLHDLLRAQVRTAAGRTAAPSAGIIDSQSVRAADTVPTATRGYDAGKKVNGRKRHLAVDTLGLLLVVLVTAACVQDRDGARRLLWQLRRDYRGIRLVWADGGYAGKLVAWAAATLHLVVQIVRKHPGQHTFEVLPRRWVVERTFAWISKHRRCVRDYERLPAHHEAMVKWAMIAVMARRLARKHPPARAPAQAA